MKSVYTRKLKSYFCCGRRGYSRVFPYRTNGCETMADLRHEFSAVVSLYKLFILLV